MILAAGLGTRLHPLTREIPKALVDVGGVPMLERVARRLIDAGADRIVVNVSSLADQIVTFLDEKTGWGVDIRVSLEPDGPLDTGGGLLRAAHLFRGDRPILIHNVDILTDIDLGVLYRDHESSSVATLAIRPARSDRYLLFDGDGMTGYAYGGKEYRARMAKGAEARRDFLGIQVVSPRLLGLLEERQKFSIFTTYMRLIGEAEIVRGREVEVATWMDIGTHEQLDAARRTFEAAE